MKILVAVKRVVNFNVKIHVKADGTGVDTAHTKMSINPFDEIAVEEAIRLKEKGVANEVVVVSLGGSVCQEVIRQALALGADRGILVQTDVELQSLAIAKLLKAVVLREKPELVILGKQAIDSDNNQVGQMLAGLLGWPQATFISSLAIENNEVMIAREIDGGIEKLAMPLPAVVTTDLRLNVPRYATLPNIMAAKKKPLAIETPEQLAVTDIAPQLKVLRVDPPPPRKPGIKVKDVAELMDKLCNEAKVL